MWDQTHDAQKSQWLTALEDQIGVTTKVSQTCVALSGSDRRLRLAVQLIRSKDSAELIAGHEIRGHTPEIQRIVSQFGRNGPWGPLQNCRVTSAFISMLWSTAFQGITLP